MAAQGHEYQCLETRACSKAATVANSGYVIDGKEMTNFGEWFDMENKKEKDFHFPPMFYLPKSIASNKSRLEVNLLVKKNTAISESITGVLKYL